MNGQEVLLLQCGRCAAEHRSQPGTVASVEVRDGEPWWCWSAVNRRSRRESGRVAPVVAAAVSSRPVGADEVAALAGRLSQAGSGSARLDLDRDLQWAHCPVHGPGQVPTEEVARALRSRRPGQRSRAVVTLLPTT